MYRASLALTLVLLASHFLRGPNSAVAANLVGGTDFTYVGLLVEGGDVIESNPVNNGDPANTANGQPGNTDFGTTGGGFSHSFQNPVVFTYEFVSETALSGKFVLHNGWGASTEAINAFTLSLLDNSGLAIGQPMGANGAAGVLDEEFELPQSYAGVKQFILRVESVHAGAIEFREVGFLLAVPEPATCLLLGSLIAGVVVCQRRR